MEILPNNSAEICRVCEINTNLINLSTNKPIVKKLRACADIQFELNDQLPKHLCQNCFTNLNQAYQFKIQCEFTDQKFRSALQETKSIVSPFATALLPSNNFLLVDNIKLEQLKSETYVNAGNSNQLPAKNHQEEENEEFSLDDDNIEFIEENENVEFIEEDENVEQNIENEIEDKDEIDAFTESYSITENYNEEIHENTVYQEENSYLFGDNDQQEELETEYKNVETKCYETKNELQENNEDYNESDDNNDDNKSEYLMECKDDPLDNSVTSSSIDLHSSKIDISSKSKQFKCDTCNEQFDGFNKCNEHKKTHGRQRYQCLICGKWFSKRYQMKNHMEIHRGDRNYECELCHKKYTNPGNLERHIRVFHYKEKSYFCKFCEKGFSQSATLKQHQAVHIEERNFECDVCHKRYKTQDYLNMHKNRHFSKENESKSSVRRSRQSITVAESVSSSIKRYKSKPKNHTCIDCGKISTSDILHKLHMRTHTGEKPYECKYCKKKFGFYQSLKSHLLLHTGEKPYMCDDCGVSFRQIGHLKGHRASVHTGVKQHKCTFCEKTFALRGNLTVHLRLHTGETPYHCLICSKKFYDSNGLKRHKQTHTRKDLILAADKHCELLIPNDANNDDEQLDFNSDEKMQLEINENVFDTVVDGDDIIFEEYDEPDNAILPTIIEDKVKIQVNENDNIYNL